MGSDFVRLASFSWAEADCDHDLGVGLRDKCVWGNGDGFLGQSAISGQRRNVILSDSRYPMLASSRLRAQRNSPNSTSSEMKDKCEVKFPDGNESIYFGMRNRRGYGRLRHFSLY